MPTPAWRMWFGTRPATAEELRRVEELVVEQETDAAWEARIRLSLCLDDRGGWRDATGALPAPFSRVRVELDPGTGRFAPLIDGPVAALDTALDATPGRSTVSLVVRDDSVLLNRDEETETFEDATEADVARRLLGRLTELAEVRVDATPGAARTHVRRGTVIAYLRRLARALGWHAYVLPGERPGRSVGCFLPDPRAPGALPPLVLLGPDRNLTQVDAREDAERPGRTRARTLRIADGEVVAAEARVQDLQLLRAAPAVDDARAARRDLPPEEHDAEDPAARAEGATRRSAYAFRVTGRVVPGCYAGVLSPYQKVAVRVGPLPLSGDWLLWKVTHRITPSVWTQEFEARCDARSDPAADARATAGAGGIPVDLAASLSIF